MIIKVESDKTLLVDGPASVHLVSGEAETLGAPLNAEETMVIRNGKRAPLYIKRISVFDITHSKGSVPTEVHGNTIPPSWHTLTQVLTPNAQGRKHPAIVMVMGEVDSGKTSLCTFLINSGIKADLTVAVIDGDLGQSDIGPPTTISLAYIDKPVRDLYHVKPVETCFVGTTSPSGATQRVSECFSRLKKQVFLKSLGLLVIDTDGWVGDDDAVRHKLMLVETFAPDAVVAIQKEKELEAILSKLKGIEIFTVEPSSAIKKRGREERKILRELSYKRYLRNSKVRVFPLLQTRTGETFSSPNLSPPNQRLREIEGSLGFRPILYEESLETIRIVLGRNVKLDVEQLLRAENRLKKKLEIFQEGEEKGLITGLHDAENRFLGLGIIHKIDYRRKVMKVLTSVTQKISVIVVGRLRLDNSFKEAGLMKTYWN